jgi:ABC-type bacteriocin/lantibiotic exporter with double-glycine peptidase domain
MATANEKTIFYLFHRYMRPHAKGFTSAAFATVISRVCSFAGPVCLGHVLNELASGRNISDLGFLTAGLVAALIVEIRLSQIGSRKLASVASRIGVSMRSSLQGHILCLPVAFFDSERLGSLVSTIMDDTYRVESILGESVAARVVKLFESALGLGYLFLLSPRLASTTTVLIAAGVLWTGRGCRKVVPLSRRHRSEWASCAAICTDLINGVRTIKGHTAEKHHGDLFTSSCSHAAQTSLHLKKTITSVYGQGSFLVGLTVPVTIAIGAELVLRHSLTIGSLVSYTVVLWRILWPFMDLLALSTDLAAGYAGMERISTLLKLPVEGSEQSKGIICPDAISGRIELRNASFSYDNRLTLRSLNCSFVPGTINALVGASGAGKSTMLSLLAGFYQPTTGAVLVDGLPLASLNIRSYRRHVAYVHQHSFIFPGSIRENILIADPHASEERLRCACEAAGIDSLLEDISSLASREMGEQGTRFSGGQRQRIAIARALLKNPAILLLDEATANLDVRADTLIQRALVTLMQGRTTIIVAHRLSTIRHADQIVVLHEGEVVGLGRHASLLRSNAYYRSLYDEEYWLAEHLNDRAATPYVQDLERTAIGGTFDV